MGLGFTFYSGAMEAWLVDALARDGVRRGRSTPSLRAASRSPVRRCSWARRRRPLGQIDLSLPYLVRSALLVAVFGVAYVVMHDLGFTPRRVTAAELPGEVAHAMREPASRTGGASGRSGS